MSRFFNRSGSAQLKQVRRGTGQRKGAGRRRLIVAGTIGSPASRGSDV